MGFDLEDGTGVVVQAACQGQIQLNMALRLHLFDIAKQFLQFFDAFGAHLVACKEGSQLAEFGSGIARKGKHGVEGGNLAVVEATLTEFGTDIV